VLPPRERDIVWFFAGQMKGDRLIMVENMRYLTPHKVHTTSGWDSSDSMVLDEMRMMLSRTIFVPCPFGNINPDSFRIMEALEYGAVPVCVKFMGVDYYRYIFGDHPFIVKNSWLDVVNTIKDFLQDPIALHIKQQEICIWYTRFKEKLATDVAAIIRGQFGSLKSKQFQYQRSGRDNPLLRLVFELHFRNGTASRIYRRFIKRLLPLSMIHKME
jgi:hypothetical protein